MQSRRRAQAPRSASEGGTPYDPRSHHRQPHALIAGFTLPTLLGLLFQQLYNLVDTMIVGKLLGSAALAAVGSTGSISFLVIGFCMGICNGFAIPVAQRIGAGEPPKCADT